MAFYLLGLGSNILPDEHLSSAYQELASLGDIMACSPTLETQAKGDTFSCSFKNQLIVLESDQVEPMLKQKLQRIEEKLGREPKSPSRKLKDRTIDIDILFRAHSFQDCQQAPLDDSYYQSVQTAWLAG